MAYGYGRYHDPELDANLPKDGERLEFGTHRLNSKERDCPAWPRDAKTSANARYAAMLRREKKNPAYMIAIANKQGQYAVAA